MIKMKPPMVLVHDSIYKSDLTKTRLEMMMKSIETNDFRVVDDAGLDEAIKLSGWLSHGGKRTGELKRKSDPAIVFNTFRFASNEEFSKRGRKQCDWVLL